MKALAPAWVLLALLAAEIVGGFGSQDAVRYVDDFGTLAAALLAAVLCARAAGRHRGRLRTFWGLLAAATGSWALGELVWAVYDIGLGGPVPVPSLADPPYLAAIPLAGAALLAHPSVQARSTGKVRAVLDGGAIAAALFFIAWLFLLGPLWRSTDLSTLGGLVMLAYPFGDVVLLFLIVLCIRGTTNRDRIDLWLLLLGLLAITVSDAAYAYLTEVAPYSTGNLVDIGWIAGYLAIGTAAWAARPEHAVEPAPAPRALTRAALLAPFVPMLAALALAAVEVHPMHHVDRIAWTTAVVLCVTVLLRQLLLAADLYAGGREDRHFLSRRILDSLTGTRS